MGLNTGRESDKSERCSPMAEFIAVVNDTDPKNGGKSYALKINGNNHAQMLGKRIGDIVDGLFVGEGDKTLSGYKLEITGGSDKTGTPMRRDLEGGNRQSILVSNPQDTRAKSSFTRRKAAARSDSATSQTVFESAETSEATPSPRHPSNQPPSG